MSITHLQKERERCRLVAYDALKEAIIIEDEEKIPSLVQQALDDGTEAPDILTNGLIAGMEIVFRRFKAGEMFLPEVLLNVSLGNIVAGVNGFLQRNY